MTIAAAMLDPDSGRISGFVPAENGRPGRALFRVNGEVAHEVVAVSPITALSAVALAKLGPPPTAFCSFSARLPADLMARADQGADLSVEAATNGATLLTQQFTTRAELARYVEGCVMADSAQIRITRLQAGVFSGRLTFAGGGAPPDIDLYLRAERIAKAVLTGADGDSFTFTATLPASAVGDGVAVIEFRIGDETLTSYAISAGEALAGDLVSELASLRAELDQLKAAFRQTLAGGVIARDERPMILAEMLTHVDNLLEARDRVRRMETIETETDEDDWDITE